MLNSADIRFISENTLLLEFGQVLDDENHQKVLKLDVALNTCSIAASIETLPTFRSLMITFDPFSLSHTTLLETLRNLKLTEVAFTPKTWHLPVCFEAPYAEDIQAVSKQLKISPREIIQPILASPLKLYMYGFTPGLAYLGGLPPSLLIPRRQTPRAPMPANSLMIGGGLACITSVSMPTGWYVLGKTPVSLFSDARDPMVPYSIGDMLQIVGVDAEEFARLEEANQQGGFITRIKADE